MISCRNGFGICGLEMIYSTPPSVKYEVHNVVCHKELDGVSVKYMP